MPIDNVSFLEKKSSNDLFAISLYLNDPAHPLAEPRTSELENPPTAPKN